MAGRIITIIVLWCICSSNNWMSKEEDYIVRHLPMALEQQVEYGIPASVTLAQALVESQAGQSALARQANNHFGIKCKEYWTGEVFFKKDDDRNSKGELIPSCFRKYHSVEQSYFDRSVFLSNSPRYQTLFTDEYTGAREWAYGLSNAGYATDPRYADKLIRVIRRYKLEKYDKFNTLELESRKTGMTKSIFLPDNYSRGSGFQKNS